MKFPILTKICCAAAVSMFSVTPLMADPNSEKGEAFLKENSTKEGVKTTASGLQYKVLRDGKGKSPKATDTVEVTTRARCSTARNSTAPTSAGRPSSFR